MVNRATFFFFRGFSFLRLTSQQIYITWEHIDFVNIYRFFKDRYNYLCLCFDSDASAKITDGSQK